MAKGNGIIVTANPKGTFIEGYITGTPKPGTMVQLDVSEATEGGRYTWEPFSADFDGQRALVAILLPDSLKGKLATDAYVTGDRCFIYCPVPGEHMNILVADVSGTADDYAVGDRLIVDSGTGKFMDSNEVGGSFQPESEPFIVMEAITDPTADTLVHCMFTGY